MHRVNLHVLEFGKAFLDMTSEAQAIKQNRQSSSKFKTALQRAPLTKSKMDTKWEKIFTNHISDKGLVHTIYKELL